MKKRDNAHSGLNAQDPGYKLKNETPEKGNFNVPLEIPATPWRSNPENAVEMVNTYGTYEIQPTANSANEFPAISQGLPSKSIKKRPESFKEGLRPDL